MAAVFSVLLEDEEDINEMRFRKPRVFKDREQGWVANSTPGIYQWHLPVFTGLENTPQVENTGKYWQIDFFALKYSRNLKQDNLNSIIKLNE